MPPGKDYPARLAALLGDGYRVFNSGDGGEDAITIPARQGAIALATAAPIQFPAGAGAVQIGDESDNGFHAPDGARIRLTEALGRDIPVNPVDIGGARFRLFFRDFRWNTPTTKISYTLWLERDGAATDAPLEIPAGTPVRFASAAAAPDAWCEIVFMGGNGGWGRDVNTLIGLFRTMLARRGEDRPYLVLVPYWESFPKDGVAAFKEAFGPHAVEFPWAPALCLGNRPDVHLNEDGYALLARLFHERGASLGYWPAAAPFPS